MTITIDRGESVAIPFTITDENNGLGGKRVTWAVGKAPPRTRAQVLAKASGLGSSSAAVTITSQTSAQIQGTINLVPADFALLGESGGPYEASLWIDDGAGTEVCVTSGGAEKLVINETVPRSPS